MSEATPPVGGPEAGPAVEVLRAWIVGQALHCTLQADAFPDPGTWGMVLADVARHLAAAVAEQHGLAPDDTLRRIRAAFDEDLSAPPAEAE
jgi:hypothetical protein